MQYYEQTLASLEQRCDDVTPLKARSQRHTDDVPITALCSYKQLNVRVLNADTACIAKSKYMIMFVIFSSISGCVHSRDVHKHVT